ncbi:phage regulatory CII family protein [Rugamonas aquatica]|nr:phage regulatory CII family protein [Rugamonas aquatica]
MNILDTLYKTAHDSPGGCEALARRLGMSAQVLRNKVNPNTSSNRATLEDVDRILGVTGDHAVLHSLARNHGYVCVRVDDTAIASDTAVLELVMKVWAASGDVGAEVHATLADGIVEQHEIERVKAAVYRVNRSLNEMVNRLEGMVQK